MNNIIDLNKRLEKSYLVEIFKKTTEIQDICIRATDDSFKVYCTLACKTSNTLFDRGEIVKALTIIRTAHKLAQYYA